MTRDDIMRMAREADLGHAGAECWQFGGGIVSVSTLVRFADLVAAAEREACAKVCEERAMKNEQAASEGSADDATSLRSAAWQLSVCAAAIRTRGRHDQTPS